MKKCIKRNKMKGFTLVELLAVIAVLGLILIIAIPKVMETLNTQKKRTLELTTKSIIKAAEEKYLENSAYGIDEEISCESVSNITSSDFKSCIIEFDEEGNASVTIMGKGRYDGINVCGGTKTSATAQEESCTPVVNAINFADDDWATIVAAVQSGNHPYQVGNTKEVDMGDLGTHTIRVANTTPCSEVDVESKTACGFVLEFADIIENAVMNDTGTNAGGWPTSKMRTYVNSTIYNVLPDALKTGIIETYVISSSGSAGTTGYENVVGENFYSTDKLYLLSPQEVWGTSFTSQYDKSNGTSRQLDYYATYQGDGYIGVSITNYEGAKKQRAGSADYWWLRSAVSYDDNGFYGVSVNGDWSNNDAGGTDGVSPAFRLAD